MAQNTSPAMRGVAKIMEYVQAQGARVPALGFGTWQLTGDECTQGVEHAIRVGYRHIDTAQMYNNEEQVGRGIANSGVARDELFVTTKLGSANLSGDRVRLSCEESLRKLGSDHVDLLLIHWPREDADLSETLAAMRGLQEAGKVHHLGISNFPPSWVKEAVALAPILTNQVEYHPYLSQDELLDLADEHDFFVTAYSPLAQGEVIDDPVLTEIAEAHQATPSQVTLRWLVQQPRVAAIPKAASPEHREANFAALDLELSDEEMNRISALRRDGRLIDHPGFAPDWER